MRNKSPKEPEKPNKLEGEEKAIIFDFLDHLKLPYRKISVGGILLGGGRFRGKNPSMEGFPDILVILEFAKEKRTLALETKRTRGGTQSKVQEDFEKWCHEGGCWDYLVASNWQTLSRYLFGPFPEQLHLCSSWASEDCELVMRTNETNQTTQIFYAKHKKYLAILDLVLSFNPDIGQNLKNYRKRKKR